MMVGVVLFYLTAMSLVDFDNKYQEHFENFCRWLELLVTDNSVIKCIILIK